MILLQALGLIIASMFLFPYLSKKLKRPTLFYGGYLVLGVFLSSFFHPNTTTVVQELGKVGFVLLLFQLGLEINLSWLHHIKSLLLPTTLWIGLQTVLFTGVAWMYGWPISYGLILSGGLAASSLQIAYYLIPNPKNLQKPVQLLGCFIVLLELASLGILIITDSFLEWGQVSFVVLEAFFFIGFVLFLHYFSSKIQRTFHRFVVRAETFGAHVILLWLLCVVILAEQVGISGSKAAFFLGLFITSTSEHKEMIKNRVYPITDKILVPFFFISLGSQIVLSSFQLFWITILSLSALYLAIRLILTLLTPTVQKIRHPYLLFMTPNLAMVAVAAEILRQHLTAEPKIDLLLAIGLATTVLCALIFPIDSTKTIT
jgi:Kef-type K+ transport system membrane component KefB